MHVSRLPMALSTAFFAVLLWAQPSMAAKTVQTTIKVIVKNELEKPVPNAEVILDFLGNRDLTRLGMHKHINWTVHTNQAGVAHFPPIPEGSVQIQVITQRYQTFGKKMDIEGAEKLVEVTLLPPQDQYSTHPALKPAETPKQ